MKDLSQRVPFRPLIRFVFMYVFLKGFLDGRAGFAWCTLQAFYEYMIVLKAWEIQHLPVATLDALATPMAGPIVPSAPNPPETAIPAPVLSQIP
jgi:hypothetical protein